MCNVVSFEFENWLPIDQLLHQLTSNQDLPATLHCIIAICTNFEFSMIDKHKTIFSEFLKVMLPALLTTLHNNNTNSELIYLSLKILWKSIHYDMPQDVKMLTIPWMELILIVITGYSEELHIKLDDNLHKNSPEFFYFHAKKWATRILLRFIQKHAK